MPEKVLGTMGVQTVYKHIKTRAPSESPILTGTPEAPTPPDTSNDDQVATTKFVKRAVANMTGVEVANDEEIANIIANFDNILFSSAP